MAQEQKTQKHFLTAEGLNESKEKLQYLTTVRRKEISEQIAIARGFGDLSENAEYDEARNEQGRIEGEILELQEYIRNAEVVDEKDINRKSVNIGTSVKVFDEDFGEEEIYDIVGPRQSNPNEGKISSESPIGSGLLGHHKGDIVTIEVPQGEIKLRIVDIEITKKNNRG